MRVLLGLTLLLASCGLRAGAPHDIDTLEERIVELVEQPDGGAHVGFERSSRWYRIDPVRSPAAERLLERARRGLESGTPVRATIDFTGTRVSKAAPVGTRIPVPVVLELELASSP